MLSVSKDGHNHDETRERSAGIPMAPSLTQLAGVPARLPVNRPYDSTVGTTQRGGSRLSSDAATDQRQVAIFEPDLLYRAGGNR